MLQDLIRTYPLLFIISLSNRIISSFKIKIIMGVFDIRLKFVEWFGLGVVSTFYNYFITKSGAFVRAIYFKKQHNLEYSKCMLSLIHI